MTPTITPTTTTLTNNYYPPNGGFEDPDLGGGPGNLYIRNPLDANWTFIGRSGIAANGSVLGVTGAENLNQFDDVTSTLGQAAFLSGNNAYMTFDSFGALLNPLPVKIYFRSQTSNPNSMVIAVSAFVDTNVYNLGSFTPTTTTTWVEHSTPSFVTLVPPGDLALLFIAKTSNANDITFIDSVYLQYLR
jgi:hypothetical protein